jgi:hypothetical protein
MGFEYYCKELLAIERYNFPKQSVDVLFKKPSFVVGSQDILCLMHLHIY